MEGVNFEFTPKNEKYQADLYDFISKQAKFWDWVVDRGPQIPRDNSDISKILELIETQFNLVFSNKTINLKIYSYQYCVEIKQTNSLQSHVTRIALSCSYLFSDHNLFYKKL